MQQKEQKKQRGQYILAAMDDISPSGDTYTDLNALYAKIKYSVSRGTFVLDVQYLAAQGKLCLEGNRIYLTRVLEDEQAAAQSLAQIIQNNTLEYHDPSLVLYADDVRLSLEQCCAVYNALSHRLSLVLGGAGTGKTTLIRGLLQEYERCYSGTAVLAAPTGKAACHLSTKTGRNGMTLHSLLGINLDLLVDRVNWSQIGLVIVDEAGMMTLEMLARLLEHCREDCRIVLVGDPGQLQSVGAGNILPDLLRLKIPYLSLSEGHRQKDDNSALYQNVTNFRQISDSKGLLLDDTFQIIETPQERIHDVLCKEAAARYAAGEDVQLLTPYREAGSVCVKAMNQALHPIVNPWTGDMAMLEYGGDVFWDNDRILVTANDRSIGCYNGETGTLRLYPEESDTALAALDLDNGHTRYICSEEQLLDVGLQHGYAITVHKSQGSEYDTILLPISGENCYLLNRRLLYTAISRAKRKVILVGSTSLLDQALRNDGRKRNTGLVERTLEALDSLRPAA